MDFGCVWRSSSRPFTIRGKQCPRCRTKEKKKNQKGKENLAQTMRYAEVDENGAPQTTTVFEMPNENYLSIR